MLQSLLFSANDGLKKAMNNSPPLRLNATGDAVRCLQIGLVALGHPLPKSTKDGTIRADGIFGPETRNAVIQFQKQNALSPDGLVGPLTLGRLDQLLVQTSNDPLLKAVHECRKSAARLIRAGEDRPADLERTDFGRTVGELDQLLLGDPVKLGIKIQALLRG